MKNCLLLWLHDKKAGSSFGVINILHFSSGTHISVFRNTFLNSLKCFDRLCSEPSKSLLWAEIFVVKIW